MEFDLILPLGWPVKGKADWKIVIISVKICDQATIDWNRWRWSLINCVVKVFWQNILHKNERTRKIEEAELKQRFAFPLPSYLTLCGRSPMKIHSMDLYHKFHKTWINMTYFVDRHFARTKAVRILDFETIFAKTKRFDGNYFRFKLSRFLCIFGSNWTLIGIGVHIRGQRGPKNSKQICGCARARKGYSGSGGQV